MSLTAEEKQRLVELYGTATPSQRRMIVDALKQKVATRQAQQQGPPAPAMPVMPTPEKGIEQQVAGFIPQSAVDAVKGELSKFWASRPAPLKYPIKWLTGKETMGRVELPRVGTNDQVPDITLPNGMTIPGKVGGILFNLLAGGAEFAPNMAAQLGEDPVKTGADLATFYPQKTSEVSKAALGSLSGFSPEEVKAAREGLYKDPLGTVMLALPFLHGVKGAGPIEGTLAKSLTKQGADMQPGLAGVRSIMEEPKASIKPPAPKAQEASASLESTYKQAAAENGVKYEGLQEVPNGKPIGTFTDPQTGTTFLVDKPQDVGAKLKAKRAEFEKPAQGEVTNRSTDIPPEGKNVITDKQPWEMTRDEFIPVWTEGAFKGNKSKIAGRGQAEILANDRVARYSHENRVKKALDQGRPVPPEVLADYPDLAAKYGKAKQGGEVAKSALRSQSVTSVPESGTTVPKSGTATKPRAGVVEGSEANYQRLRSLARRVKSEGDIDGLISEEFGSDPTITLYRGINASDRPSSFDSDPTSAVGKFWTTKLPHAQVFANRGLGGKVYQLELKASDLLRARLRGQVKLSGGQIELPAELQRNAKQIQDVTTKPQGGEAAKPALRSQSVTSVPESGTTVPKSGTAPKPQGGGTTLRHSGFNPFHHVRKAFQLAFGEKGVAGGRRLVNPFGTPEITLEGRGIVEPFIKQKETLDVQRTMLSEKLNKTFEGIKKNSPEDRALFDQLNDPKAELSGRAAELRKVFDDLLALINKHRTARGQEPVAYRKGYITHIVDYTKEQQGLFNDIKIPKQLRFAFEKRKGATSFKRSAMQAVETYVDAALKDVYIGDALYEAVPNVEKLTFGKSRPIITTKTVTTDAGGTVTRHFYDLSGAIPLTERGYAEAFVKRQLGWPTKMEKTVSAVLRISPRAQRATSQAVTATFYRSLIGMALDTPIKNLTQGINTIAELGIAPGLRGYAKLATRRGIQAARGENLLSEFQPLLNGGEALKLSGVAKEVGKAIDNTVLAGPMRFGEFVNRGSAYHAAFDLGIKRRMSIEDAHEYARSIVRKTQFAYGGQNISPYMQSAYVRPFYQFLSFPTKQAELMYRWAVENNGGQAKLLRYFAITGALVTGGMYLGVDLSGVFLSPFKAVDPDSKEGFNLPGSDKRVAFSLKKLAESGFIPQGPAPIISAPMKIGKRVLSGEDYQLERARRDAISMFVPGGRYGLKLWDVATDSPITGARGRLIRKPSTLEKGLKLGGFRETEREIEWDRREKTRQVEDDYYKRRQKIVDLIIANKGEEANREIQKIYEDYPYLYERLMNSLTFDAIKEEAQKKGQTSEQRFYDNSIRQLIRNNMNR